MVLKMSKKLSGSPGLVHRPFDDSTSLVEAIFQASSDLLFYLEQDGRIVDYVAGSSSSLYTIPENFLGRRMVDVLPADVADLFENAIEKTLATGQVTPLEYDLEVPAGRRSYEAKCILRSGGKIIITV